MLQIQPQKDVIVEFIKNEDFKGVRTWEHSREADRHRNGLLQALGAATQREQSGARTEMESLHWCT